MEYGVLATANDTVTSGGAPAELVAINVGTGAATAVITVYNGTSTGGAVVAIIDAATPNSFQFEGIHLGKGLFVQLTTANAKATVTYQ